MSSRKRRFADVLPADKAALDSLVATTQAIVLEARELDGERIRLPLLPSSGLAQHEVMTLTAVTTNFLLDREGIVVFMLGSPAFKELVLASVKRVAESRDVVVLSSKQKGEIPPEHHGNLEAIAFHVRRHVDTRNFELSKLGGGRYMLSTAGLQRVLASEAMELASALAAFAPEIHYSFDGDELRVRVKVAM